MSELDAVGDVVSGSALARSVEPASGADPGDGHTHEVACLNCATPLAGDYCHACGQRGHVHRTLGAFFHDLLHGVLHFEGKIWRTLPLLAFRPGRLTRAYIDGKRAAFVSPIALFLFSIFLMFAVISNLGGPMAFEPVDDLKSMNQIDKRMVEADAELVGLRAQRAKLLSARQPAATLDEQLRKAEAEVAMLRAMKENGVAEAALTRIVEDGSSDDAGGWLNDQYLKAKKNPSLLLYKLQSASYKFSWALIPISVPFLWLLFPFNRRYRLYDHTVFVTYSLCFVSLLVIGLSLLRAAGLSSGVAVTMLMILPPVHFFAQLKGTYALSRWAALWRTLALTWFASIAFVLFGLLVLALGISD